MRRLRCFFEYHRWRCVDPEPDWWSAHYRCCDCGATIPEGFTYATSEEVMDKAGKMLFASAASTEPYKEHKV